MLRIQIPIDEMFDLDSALTMPDDSTDREMQQQEEEDRESKAKAVADRLLDEMPTVVGGGSHCAVCAEGLRLGAEVKRIPCGHVFHHDCISRWLSVNYSCPLCREMCPPPGKLSSD